MAASIVTRAMTKGTDDETVDGMSMEKVAGIIEQLKYERYRWTPVRRIYIPKKDGKQRPLGIPTWTDKLLQEVVRSILEAYYEPQFSPTSHGFRPERGCHTALKDIFHAWKGTKWFIEGDIKGYFDNIDHTVLLSILREKIRDNRLLILLENLLKAGYLEQWSHHPTLSGTPQGGVISPLLSNIYLDRLDKFVAQTLVPEHTKGKKRKSNPEYMRLWKKIDRLQKKGSARETWEPLQKELDGLSNTNQFDPDYRRLRYIRYADDFLLGFTGPRDEAEEIKVKIGDFLRETLKLELSPEKTLITHAGTEHARFLGYDIGANWNRLAGNGNGNITFRIPTQVMEAKIAKYIQDEQVVKRPELQCEDDFTIVALYGSEYRGIVQYYAFAENRYWLTRLHWVMRGSLLKTLAAKHRTTVSKLARNLASETYDRGRWLKCLEVRVEREGKDPLIARFGGLRLTPDPFLAIVDLPIDRDRIGRPRNELIDRLLANTCELCGAGGNVQVHHVRKLADLNVKGRREKPLWQQIMASRKRKTLVVCKSCHRHIHAGQPVKVPAHD